MADARGEAAGGQHSREWEGVDEGRCDAKLDNYDNEGPWLWRMATGLNDDIAGAQELEAGGASAEEMEAGGTGA
jgi:hypothetical protein